MEDLFTVNVVNKDPKDLSIPVYLWVPLEIRGDGELDDETGAAQGLDEGSELELWKRMNQAMQQLSHLRYTHELANLC